MPPSFLQKGLTSLVAATLLAGFPLFSQAELAQNHSFVGEYDPDQSTFLWLREANDLVGTSTLYGLGYWGMNSKIANVEGGLAWSGHDVFRTREEGVQISLGPGISWTYTPNTLDQNSSVSYDPDTAPGAGQIDGHATAVAGLLAGLGMDEEGNLLILGTGMAPLAEIQSGAIAVSWSGSGNFSITKESFLTPYLQFFTGGSQGAAGKMDVINSSWGYTDSSARLDEFSGILDGLARENSTVTFVASAGNDGPSAAPAAPAAGFNGISVGALEVSASGAPSRVADFSSSAPLDFYNPVTEEFILNARAGVHIAAPGTGFVLPAYDETNTSATDLYYINADGTSFAAPMVSGGVALLKDLAKTEMAANTTALDSRVIRSVLMAGASRTAGWDNGQEQVSATLIRTTQALDYAVGAGLMNLTKTVDIYRNAYSGDQREGLGAVGWTFDSVADQDISYSFLDSETDIELTISLNWFAATDFDEATESYTDLWFSDLNLSIWLIEGDIFTTMVAESASTYGNSEFLRITLSGNARYGFLITNEGTVFDTTGNSSNFQTEDYAVAWSILSVPEPGTASLFILSLTALFFRRRRG